MTIGKTVFEYNGSTYRLQGFLFVYVTKEGEKINHVECSESEANAVHGCGVCGCIAMLDKIKVLDRVIPHDIFLSEVESHLREITDEFNVRKLKWLKSLKAGLTTKGYKSNTTKRINKSFWKAIHETQAKG